MVSYSVQIFRTNMVDTVRIVLREDVIIQSILENVNVPHATCAQRRFRSACASMPADQRLLCPHEETHGNIKNAPSEDSDQIARMRSLI